MKVQYVDNIPKLYAAAESSSSAGSGSAGAAGGTVEQKDLTMVGEILQSLDERKQFDNIVDALG